MKVKQISLCVLAALAALSCTKEVGKRPIVTFSLSGTEADIVEVTKGNVSSFTTLPQSGDFTLVVKASDGTEVYNGLLSVYDATTTTFPADNYSVKATFGAEGTEGFDKPYFVGTKDFEVHGGETTAVNIPVALGNSIVKFSYGEWFKKYFSSYSFQIVTGSGTTIDFAQGETKAAFVDAYKFTVKGNFTTQDGQSKTFEKEYASLEPAKCYTIGFEVSNVGSTTLTVTFNDTVETVNLGETELND